MKKNINIVLILVVLGLWGTVGYKTINQYFFPKNQIDVTSATYSGNTIKIAEKDTFELKPIARDPFLSRSLVVTEKPKTIVVRTVRPSQPTLPKEPKYTAPFPTINYYGYIKSTDKKNELVLLKINSKLNKVRLNDNIEGLIVKKIFKDSIQVSYNGEIKSFRKK